MKFQCQTEKIVNNTRNALDLDQNTSKYCGQIIVVHVHANCFQFAVRLIKCDR